MMQITKGLACLTTAAAVTAGCASQNASAIPEAPPTFTDESLALPKWSADEFRGSTYGELRLIDADLDHIVAIQISGSVPWHDAREPHLMLQAEMAPRVVKKYDLADEYNEVDADYWPQSEDCGIEFIIDGRRVRATGHFSDFPLHSWRDGDGASLELYYVPPSFAQAWAKANDVRIRVCNSHEFRYTTEHKDALRQWMTKAETVMPRLFASPEAQWYGGPNFWSHLDGDCVMQASGPDACTHPRSPRSSRSSAAVPLPDERDAPRAEREEEARRAQEDTRRQRAEAARQAEEKERIIREGINQIGDAVIDASKEASEKYKYPTPPPPPPPEPTKNPGVGSGTPSPPGSGSKNCQVSSGYCWYSPVGKDVVCPIYANLQSCEERTGKRCMRKTGSAIPACGSF